MAVAATIPELLLAKAASIPDQPALIWSGGALSYRGLSDHVQAAALRLRSEGAPPGARVAVALPNGPELAAAFLAAASAGSCAPLNLAYRLEEFDFYLSDLAPAAVICGDPDHAAAEAARRRGIRVLPPFPLEQVPAGDKRAEWPGADAEALALHTSGTTSRPKLVPLTHRNLLHSATNIAETLRLSPQDRCLNVMPLFHIHGLAGALLSTLTAGGSFVATEGFQPLRFFSWLEEFEPTWYTAVPTMHQAILARAARNRDAAANSRLRFIRSSSAPLPPAVMEALEETFDAPVIESYGMTEAAHQMASNPLPPAVRKPGSVGQAAGPEIGVLDSEGRPLPAGQRGEVVIRGESVMAGYAGNPGATADAFVNGWFRTGDLGWLDEEGYLFLCGRLKEIINRGGEKISPREIDEALLQHPAVAQAVAFALPHEKLGEEVAAAVVLRPEADANERELREFLAERLADFKLPRKFVFVDEIPKGPTGKPQRIGLAEKLGLA